jgi:SAM-dependent methyltransferase
MIKYFSTFELIFLAILLVPTCYAMIMGAPFVPTQMEQVNRMLKAANIKKGMRLYDLGSGDGRLVHKAAKEYGAAAIGYEFSPLVYAWSKFLSIFWRSGAKIRFGNFWKKDFHDADVIVCYLLPYSMKNMGKMILPQLRPGTIIVSHAFQIEGLKPWKSLPRLRPQKLGPIWIYKIQAKKK